ncbi:MAG: hypothetical protein D6820_08840, partial [Lentisphaerae bacterium]
TITDPRFKNGKMPAVDIEIEYALPAWAGVELYADTARGAVKVARGWGDNRWFRKLKVQLDDAWFGEREFGNSTRSHTCDGFDLRFNGFSADLYLRSIRIKGYPLTGDVDFGRLLRLTSIDSSQGGPFLFPTGSNEQLIFTWRNLSHEVFSGSCQYTLTSHSGRLLKSGSLDFQVPADASSTFRLPIDTHNFKHGVYYLNTRITYPKKGKEVLIMQRRVAFGVHNRQTVPKAEPGQFLYGLDVKLGPCDQEPILLKWLEYLGVDIVRAGARLHELDRAMPVFRRHNLKIMPMANPPYDKDPARMQNELDKRCRQLTELAKRHPDLIYWELGNEPNLPFFYKGSMADYVRVTKAMYQALKKGNPKTVVTNGGLAFAGGKTGQDRYYEYLRLQDPKFIDAWSYHAHGPLVHAERRGLSRIKATLNRLGKSGKPFIDTESGVAADTPLQEEIQARTCIEKLVFAQSEGLPLLMWFRLLFKGGRSYSNLYTPKEPRPVILAYRTLTQQLKNHRFVQRIEIDPSGEHQVEAYLFRRSTRNVLVLWSNREESFSVTLDLAPAEKEVTQVEGFDKYANPYKVDRIHANTIQFITSEDPIFIVWHTPEPAALPKPGQPVIGVPSRFLLRHSIPATLPVSIHNPFSRPLQAELSLNYSGRHTMQLPNHAIPVQLAAGQTVKQEIPLCVKLNRKQRLWPQTWRLFTGIQSGIDLTRYTSQIPASLPGHSGPCKIQTVTPRNHTIDIAAITGTIKVKTPAVLMAMIEAPKAMTIEIGASADWWMEWYVNGRLIYDTLEKGNGSGFSILDHTFNMPLRQGKNLIAVRVLSGSMGWKLLCAGPEDLRQTRNRGREERLLLCLKAGDRTVSSQTVNLEYITPIPRAGADYLSSAMTRLPATTPFLNLSQSHVTNPFELMPDRSKWWRGDADLSLKAWLAADGKYLHLIARVQDQTHHFPNSATAMWQHDSLQIGLSTDRKGFNEYAIGLVKNQVTIFKHHVSWGVAAGVVRDNNEIKARIIPAANHITYIISIAITPAMRQRLYLNILANDDDFGNRKQFIQWRPGLGEAKKPEHWPRIWLP